MLAGHFSNKSRALPAISRHIVRHLSLKPPCSRWRSNTNKHQASDFATSVHSSSSRLINKRNSLMNQGLSKKTLRETCRKTKRSRLKTNLKVVLVMVIHLCFLALELLF
jgi:hypothetical protein